MDSDDDFQTNSPPKEPSPDVHYRRLKRLKKSSSKPQRDALPESVDDPLLFPHIDFAKLEALENDTEIPDSNDSNSTEEAVSSQESVSQGIDNENEANDEDESGDGLDEQVKKTKRVLEFDDEVIGRVGENERAIGEDSEALEPEMNEKERIGEDSVALEPEMNEKERIGEEDLVCDGKDNNKKNKKKRRVNDDGVEDLKRGSNKRREEKERKAYLKELHAESQRLLRETRDASFKPIPVVHKPISSVLEKIRKRKLEISKKAIVASDRSYERSISPRDKSMDLDLSNKEKGEVNMATVLEKETVAPSLDVESSLADLDADECNNAAKQTTKENDKNEESPNEEPMHAFRAPLRDTEELFDETEPKSVTAEQNSEQANSPLDEEFAPSLLAMDLKFDSAPVDESSLDEEEDNEKENIDPHHCGLADVSSSPRGDPVKNFMDEEAEEEDDSDHDLDRFQEKEEDEDIEDFEELNDMIATGYEERPIDGEKRNELHQKWLEQQDAAGTDNIMQRLKCGSGIQDALLLDEESETDGEDEESDVEANDNSPPLKSTRVNTKKAKQLILQMLSDKEEVYFSDDEDDSHRRQAQRLLIRKEELATVVSPADDESSREVFGLIKKLNIVSDNKRKPKALSFFDSMLKGGNSNISSKSSFLGRSNHSSSSLHKQGSGSVRSFIFGRDDSNSRSSISISEDSSDTLSGEIRTTKTITAKYSSSKVKFSNQTRNGGLETAVSRTSLLEVLKKSSLQTQGCDKDSAVDLTKSILAFRVPKKPMKIEGRS